MHEVIFLEKLKKTMESRS